MTTINWLGVVTGVVAALMIGVYLGFKAHDGGLKRWMTRPLDERKPTFFFVISLGYLGALLLILCAQWQEWIDVPELIPGVVPAAIPWFGALGAVTISLYGVFEHHDDWDAKWNTWHLARPFVGAILATVAVMIFVGFINAAGMPVNQGAVKEPVQGTTTTTTTTTTADAGAESPAPAPAPARSASDDLPYLVVAFVVGFREETFRKLIKRVIDVILGPGIPGETPPASALVTPSPLGFPGVDKDQKDVKALRVTNNGTGNLYVNPVDRNPAGVVLETEAADGIFELQDDNVSGATILPGSFAEVSVQYHRPDNDLAHDAEITFNTNAGVRVVKILGHRS